MRGRLGEAVTQPRTGSGVGDHAGRAAARTERSPASRGNRAHRRRGRAAARLLICIVFVLAPSASLLGCGATAPSEAPEPDAWVTIGRARVATEIARSFEEKARGLGGRDGLDWDHGMLFPYAKPGFLAFWMKDMRFAIDIVWIRQARIVDIAHRVPFDPGGPGPTVRPRELADSVLEVPAGYAQAQGWRRGDRVEIVENDAR